MLNIMKRVYTFGFLKIRKSYSKTAHQMGDQNLKLTSAIFGKYFIVFVFAVYKQLKCYFLPIYYIGIKCMSFKSYVKRHSSLFQLQSN